jgi:transglutaminase-like putative cysteine protease
VRHLSGALFASILLLLLIPRAALAAASPPPFEIVKDHVDIALQTDGSFTETRDVTYRLLTDTAIQSFRQMSLGFTDGYQNLAVIAAYTLKPDGMRYDVPGDQMLKGYGATTSPGFEDLKTIQIVFPNLEVGDEIVLTTALHQIKPWFDGQFAESLVYSPTVVTRDVSISLEAPQSLNLQIDNLGLAGGTPESAGGTVKRTWSYRNDNAIVAESGAVSPIDTGPRLLLSTFSDQAQIAKLYRRMMQGKADASPQVKVQADLIVAGISDRRAQARALYEWVSAHIGYVNIVLGAGGFIPHSAPEILQTHYGDCKDHVVVLTALLAAEGIVSHPVLIDATNRYSAPAVASPFIFNHMINYLPEFQLYVDSTARYVPFGELPLQDADKPVLNIAAGVLAQTPVFSADQSTIRTVTNAKIARDGSAEGDTHITATGSFATGYRSLFRLINATNEATMFQKAFGPGGTGSLDKGNIEAMTGPYAFGVHFHQDNAASMPGPAGIYPEVGFRLVPFTDILGGDLPPVRTVPYVCESMKVEEDVTLTFPDGIRFTSIPDAQTLKTDGVTFSQDIERIDQTTLHTVTSLRLDHPRMTCGADYYARIRPKLTEMITALTQQVVYRLRAVEDK